MASCTGNISSGAPHLARFREMWDTTVPDVRLYRLALGAKPRDLQFRGPFLEMFFDRGIMGLRPTQGDEKRLLSEATLHRSTALPFVISPAPACRGICGFLLLLTQTLKPS
jgi:hypothetical protein